VGFRILGLQVRYFREQLISPLVEFEPLRLLVAFNSNHTTNDCDYQATEGDYCRNNRDAHGWLCLAKTREYHSLYPTIKPKKNNANLPFFETMRKSVPETFP
jgi:hypothetical protein